MNRTIITFLVLFSTYSTSIFCLDVNSNEKLTHSDSCTCSCEEENECRSK